MAKIRARKFSPEELERIREHLESFDEIEIGSEEMRDLIEAEWPHLVDRIRRHA